MTKLVITQRGAKIEHEISPESVSVSATMKPQLSRQSVSAAEFDSVIRAVKDQLELCSGNSNLRLAMTDDDQLKVIAAANDLLGVVQSVASVDEKSTTGSVATEDHPTGAAELRRTSILLVEDNTVNRMVAEGMLRQFNCEIDVAENGIEAVGQFQKTTYDIVFMDCQMPQMDGFEAAARIREIETEKKQRRTPVIALTANALKGDRDRCLDAGMDDYVSKPFSMNDLCSVIERQLDVEKTAQFKAISTDDTEHAVATKPPRRTTVIDAAVLGGIKVLTKTDGDNLLRRVIEVFLSTSPELVRKLRAALIAQDCKEIVAAAHSMRSCCGCVGATQFSDFCQAIENSAKNNNISTSISDSERIVLHYNAVCAELRDVLAVERA